MLVLYAKASWNRPKGRTCRRRCRVCGERNELQWNKHGGEEFYLYEAPHAWRQMIFAHQRRAYWLLLRVLLYCEFFPMLAVHPSTWQVRLLQSLESPFVTGYVDQIVTGGNMNLVMELCSTDLGKVIAESRVKG